MKEKFKIIIAWFLIWWVIINLEIDVLFLFIDKNWLTDFSDWTLAIILLILSSAGWFVGLKWAFKKI